MKKYLEKHLDWQTDEIVNQYDELPLWSSVFGQLILNNFPINKYDQYLDVGCGTGFPLIDIAQRLGDKCRSIGIDSWHSAVRRAKTKIETIGTEYIQVIEADASDIPFSDNFFDLITSNLGINNFANPQKVLTEIYRVLKSGRTFCTTTNLVGTFDEFYTIFEKVLHLTGLYEKYRIKYHKHLDHRGTLESMRELLISSGFKIEREISTSYVMRFLNGSTFLNHSVIIVGFIDAWRSMLDTDDKEKFFEHLERSLNVYSEIDGELRLSIPMVYFECRK